MSRTREERHERRCELLTMAGVIIFIGLAFIFGVGFGMAMVG